MDSDFSAFPSLIDAVFLQIHVFVSQRCSIQGSFKAGTSVSDTNSEL